MDHLTSQINQSNVMAVRELIARKITDEPYFANDESVMRVVTDMDHHPYSRFYRGIYYYPDPVMFEREAGYREQEDPCYKAGYTCGDDKPPEMCFEPACSTIFPCYTKERPAFVDMAVENAVTNGICIVKNY